MPGVIKDFLFARLFLMVANSSLLYGRVWLEFGVDGAGVLFGVILKIVELYSGK